MSSGRGYLVAAGHAWEETIDLLGVVAVVALTYLLLFQLGDLAPLVRAVTGIVFVVFVPGYALVSALFPEANRSASAEDGRATAGIRSDPVGSARATRGISGGERAALSFGLSLTLVPLIVIGLQILSVATTRGTVFLTLSAVTLGCAGAGAIRRWRLPGEQRFRLPYRRWLRTGKQSVVAADSNFDAFLNVALIVAMVLAVGALTFAVVAPQDGETFTEFYVLTETDDGDLVADNYPRALSADTQRTVHIGIENRQQAPVTYTVVVQLQGLSGEGSDTTIVDRSEVDRYSTTLGHNETSIRERSLAVEDGPSTDRRRLLFLLYVDDVPGTPTRETAYRTLHLWVEGAGTREANATQLSPRIPSRG